MAKRYANKATESGFSQFALKLAYKSFFGPSIMKKCSVMGERGRLGLPQGELSALKKLISQSFPVTGMSLKNLNHCGPNVLLPSIEPATGSGEKAKTSYTGNACIMTLHYI